MIAVLISPNQSQNKNSPLREVFSIFSKFSKLVPYPLHDMIRNIQSQSPPTPVDSSVEGKRGRSFVAFPFSEEFFSVKHVPFEFLTAPNEVP